MRGRTKTALAEWRPGERYPVRKLTMSIVDVKITSVAPATVAAGASAVGAIVLLKIGLHPEAAVAVALTLGIVAISADE